MKERTKAYAAGILDSDGCIDIRKQDKENGCINYGVTIIVQTSDGIVTKWLVENFGGSVRFIKSQNPRQKDSYRWEIHNQTHGRRFISLVGPYVILKKQLVDLTKQYYDLDGKRDPAARLKIFNAFQSFEQSSVTTETSSLYENNNLINPYFAGFFDGEGSVQISKAKQNAKGFSYNPRVATFNTSRNILIIMMQKYGGWISTYRSRKKGHKPLNTCVITKSALIETFLLKMLPYLTIKRERANLLLQFLRMRRKQDPSTRERLYRELKKLNFRGR